MGKAKKMANKATTKKGPVKCDQEAAEQSADAGILPPESVEVEVEGAEKAKLDNAGANAKCDKAKKMANKATTKKGPVKSAKKEKGDWAKKANNKMKVIAYL